MPADAETDSGKALSLPSGRCVRDAIAGAVILFLVSALANTALYRIARTERVESLHDQLH